MKDKLEQIENLEDKALRRQIIRQFNQIEHYEAASLYEISAFVGLEYGEQQGSVNKTPAGGYGNFVQRIGSTLNHRLNQVVECIDYTDTKNILIKLEGGK